MTCWLSPFRLHCKAALNPFILFCSFVGERDLCLCMRVVSRIIGGYLHEPDSSGMGVFASMLLYRFAFVSVAWLLKPLRAAACAQCMCMCITIAAAVGV